MENSLKGLLLAAGTIITCIVISLGFFIAREARDTAAGGAGEIGKLNAEFNESDKVMYDGLKVSGSEVVNVINKFCNKEMSIKVETKKGKSYYNMELKENDTVLGSSLTSSNLASIKDAQNPMKGNYINPNAQFLGSVLRDTNYTIIGIYFSQID